MKKLKAGQIKKEILNICNVDLQQDWKVYHNLIIAYLESIGSNPSINIDEEITNHFFNAKKVSDFMLDDFIYNYLENIEELEIYNNNYYLNDL